MPLKVFHICFLDENEINWENCVWLCTYGAQSMAVQNAVFRALVRKKAPRIIWTHCTLHRHACI
jgi:hypothetical protein